MDMSNMARTEYRLNNEIFIKRAKKTHGDKYDYNKTEYKNVRTKVCIICPDHGEFLQFPKGHINGQGCPKCAKIKNYERVHNNPTQFLKTAKERFGDKYEYPNIENEYTGSHCKITIKCNECGCVFIKTPCDHATSHTGGCPDCHKAKLESEKEYFTFEELQSKNSLNLDLTPFEGKRLKNEFIEVNCLVHGIYNIKIKTLLQGKGKCSKCIGTSYAKSKNKEAEKKLPQKIYELYEGKLIPTMSTFKNVGSKMEFICRDCGEKLYYTPNGITSHKLTHPCPICDGFVSKMDTETFIKRAKQKHGDKFDYSQVFYKTTDEYVDIICHEKDEFGVEHGIFKQTPHSHLHGTGCPKCSNKFGSQERFIKLAKKIFHDEYDYSEIEYQGAFKKVKIKCSEHGVFRMKPNNHLSGQGCPWCTKSNLELEVKAFLEKNSIRYINNHTFDWLIYNNQLRLDFYLPDYNIAIECQGEQHYRPIKFFGGEEGFKINKKRDGEKLRLCNEHGIEILYYSSYKKLDESIDIIRTQEELLKEIIKFGKVF